jgi:hypothetical protein
MTVTVEDRLAFELEFTSSDAQERIMSLQLEPGLASVLIGSLLLALRHPDNLGPSSEKALALVRDLINMVRDCGFPAMAKIATVDLDVTLAMRGDHGT